MKIGKGLSQAYEVQDIAFEALARLGESLKGRVPTKAECQALSQLINAWNTAQDRVRIHRRVPLPGVARVPVGKRQGARSRDVSAFLANLAPQQREDDDQS